MVAGSGKRRDDMAELVGGLGKAVDQEDGPFGRGTCKRKGLCVVEADFRVGFLEPDLAVADAGFRLGGHYGCILSVEYLNTELCG